MVYKSMGLGLMDYKDSLILTFLNWRGQETHQLYK